MYKDSPCKIAFLEYSTVMYCSEDQLGKLIAIFSIVPQAEFLAITVGALFAPRKFKVLFSHMAFILLWTTLLNGILKELIRQDRPSRAFGSYGEYGMPSSHTQFQSTFAFALARTLQLNRQRLRLRSAFCAFSYAALFLSVLFVSVSRVYYPHHTISQVCTGILVGALTGYCAELSFAFSISEKLTDLLVFISDTIVFHA